MIEVHPQYIKGANGNESLVILPVNEFDAIMEELEYMDDVRLYGEVKKNDTGERIFFSDYLKNRKKPNA
jgi:hypothetical protein